MLVDFDTQQNGNYYTEEMLSTSFCRLSQSEVFSYLARDTRRVSHIPLKNKAESAFRKIIEQTADDVANRAALMGGEVRMDLVKSS